MQPLFIGPYDIGAQQNLKPFMVPEQAFPDLLNAFVFRGRVERKAGYSILGRLARVPTSLSLGNFDSGTTVYNLISLLGITEPNAQLTPGFVITIGAPDSQTLTDSGTGTLAIAPPNPALITSAKVNYSTGVLTLIWGGAVGASAATYAGSYYPLLPVMGIRTEEVPMNVNQESTIFFDTTYAYRFNGAFQELPSTLPTTWTGTDSQQFWSDNFQVDSLNNALFWATNNVPGLHQFAVTLFAGTAGGPPSTVNVTAAGNTFQLGDTVFFANLAGAGAANNATFGTVTVAGNPVFTISNPGTAVFANGIVTGMALTPNRNVTGDGIRFYNTQTWANFNPITHNPSTTNNVVSPGEVVMGCLLLVPYKNRLVLLNTVEGNSDVPVANAKRFPQRARWSQNGTVLDFTQGWRDDIAGRGGFDDAATEENIISCGFVKDELIVYFERSTWKLVYTANELQPFIWQRINAELGAESTFSAVRFDEGLIAFGNVGIHTCNGAQVARIDQVIPDTVFQIHNFTDGPKRVSGIRDFFQEIVYFAYPNANNNAPTDATKKFYPNSMVIFNYRNNTFAFFDDNATALGYFQRVDDTPWSSLNTFPWESWEIPWNSGVFKAGFPSIAFGNQQGFVEVIEPQISSNSETLTIANIVGNTITSPQHNLFVDQYVVIKDALGVTGVNGITFRVVTVTNANTFTIDGAAVGTYAGSGVLTVVTNVNVLTKQFTPFWSKGRRYDLKYVDLLFDRTSAGEIGVNVFVDFTDTNNMTDTSSGVVLGNPVVSTAAEGANLPYYSFQQQGPQIWKRFYTVVTGETFQLQLTFNDSELRSRLINESEIVVHGMIFHFDESGAFY